MRKGPLLLLLAGLLSAGAWAKDLGTVGHLFPIAEPDFLDFIQHRLGELQKSGELSRIQREAEARVNAHAVRPPSVAGLPPAGKDRSWQWDPTFTVKQTVRDLHGNVIARAGDRINPLSHMAYSEVLYFVDGDNSAQMVWVKAQTSGQQNVKVILVNGNVHDVSNALDMPVYFDQAGTLTTKFGIEHTPVRISRDGLMLKVEEVKVK